LIRINFVAVDGTLTPVVAEEGTSIMAAAVANNVNGIVGECGGSAMCATCHVYVDEQFIPILQPIAAVESEMLEGTISERRQNSRLACQLKVGPELNGIVVRLPERQT